MLEEVQQFHFWLNTIILSASYLFMELVILIWWSSLIVWNISKHQIILVSSPCGVILVSKIGPQQLGDLKVALCMCTTCAISYSFLDLNTKSPEPVKPRYFWNGFGNISLFNFRHYHISIVFLLILCTLLMISQMLKSSWTDNLSHKA